MNLVMQARNMRLSDRMREWMERRLAFALERFAPQLGEVRAVIEDENGPRGGTDKHCTIEARLKSTGRVIVDVKDADAKSALSRAADRLARRIRDTIERRRDVRRRRASKAKA